MASQKMEVRRLGRSGEHRRKPRSPLKEKPLRQAGQSVEEKRLEILDDAFSELLIPLIAVLLAVLEWWRYSAHNQLHPWHFTVVALIAVAIVVPRFFRALKQVRQQREGREGERMVAERLDHLRDHGFRIIHDLVASDFNIDHVAVGPSGVFAIETKTLTKRGGREETAQFDGQSILINGARLPRNPIDQATANAKWVREFLHQSTGQWFRVTPVVILPGWYVTSKVPMRDTIVINDHTNSLQSCIAQRPESLSAEQIALICTHLALFIRRPHA